jgi:hypothetical protein
VTPRTRSTSSATPFFVVAALVLAVTGWLGWHMYNQPSHPGEARMAATTMTSIVLAGAGGHDTACTTVATALAPVDSTEAATSRCEAFAQQVAAGFGGYGPIQVGDVHVVRSDLARSSGQVTVEGTIGVRGQSFAMTLVWPVGRVDGHWKVTGGPEVQSR